MPQTVISMTLNDITSFDCLIALILLLFLIRGLWIGFVRQLAATFALAGSYWLAARYIGLVMPHVKEVVDQPGLVFLVSFAALFIISASVFILIGSFLHNRLEVSVLGWLNRCAGSLLGLIQGAAVAVLLHMILSSVLPPSHHLFQNSLTVPWLGKGAESIRQLIQDAKVRDDLQPEKDSKAKKDGAGNYREGAVRVQVVPN